MSDKKKYGCTDYRKEMTLASLRKKLHGKDLSDPEKKEILALIEELERDLGLR